MLKWDVIFSFGFYDQERKGYRSVKLKVWIGQQIGSPILRYCLEKKKLLSHFGPQVILLIETSLLEVLIRLSAVYSEQ